MFNAKIRIIDANDDTVTFEAICSFCGKVLTKTFPRSKELLNGYTKRLQGHKIQDCFPWMNDDDREFFITGNCPCVWGE